MLKRTMTQWLAIAALVAAAWTTGGCTTNPATGRLQFDQLSTDQEVAIGEEAMPQMIEEYGGELDDPVLQEYVNRVGQTLAQHTEAYNPDLPWEFTVLDSEIINAFALPGGKVFISRGLLQEMQNEAQLAGVLGHEIGHVTAQHVDERLTSQMGIAIGADLLGQWLSGYEYGAIANVLVGVGGQGFLLKYGRDQELESDALGMRYMARAGYDPAAQAQVMEILANATGPGGPPEFFSTHPYPDTRIQAIEALLKGEFAYTQNNPEYQLYENRWEEVVAPRLARLPAPKQVISGGGGGSNTSGSLQPDNRRRRRRR